MKFCPKCGTQLNDDAVFCRKCGYSMQAREAGQPVPTDAPKPEAQKPVQSPQSPKGKGNTAVLAVVIAAVLIAAAAIVYFCVIRKPSEGKKSAVEKEQVQTQAQTQAKAAPVEKKQETAAAVKANEVTGIDMEITESSSAGYKAAFIGKDASGNEVWRNDTGILPHAELDAAENIGIRNGIGYYYCDGVNAVDPQTGNLLWNVPIDSAGICYDFDQAGNLYICGYYGGQLYKIDRSGNVLFKISYSPYGWPYGVTVNGSEVTVEFGIPDDSSPRTYSCVDGSFVRSKETIAWVVGCNDNISLRVAPDTKADRITYILLYASLDVLETAENGFLKVRYNGMTGYSLAEYISYSEPQTWTGVSMQVYNCTEYITLRNGPATSYDEIVKIPVGSYVQYIKENGDFYLISYNGYVGYGLKDYLRIAN